MCTCLTLTDGPQVMRDAVHPVTGKSFVLQQDTGVQGGQRMQARLK